MLAVGLGGGIGSGKSAVADRLVERGAVLVDADVIAREVVAPGGAAYQPVVDRFGPGVVLPDGELDRPALAAVVFHDEQALADLNGLTHPAINAEMRDRRAQWASSDRVVVFAIPLLRPEHREGLQLDRVVVVDCPIDVAIDRLVELRGMDRADAAARVAAQSTREERLAGADYVVDNGGTLDGLDRQVDRLWVWLGEQRPGTT